MNTTELRKPLIQTAVVLAAIIFLISIVGGSESTSFFGMIGAIIGGILRLVLLVIGLAIALVFSIACLIGVFFGAVALYSVEDAKRIFSQFLDNVARVKASYTGCEYTPVKIDITPEEVESAINTKDEAPVEIVEETVPKEVATPPVVADPKELEKLKSQLHSSLEEINQSLTEIKTKESTIEESITALSKQLEAKAGTEISDQVNGLVSGQEEANSAIAEQVKRLEGLEASLADQSNTSNDLTQQITKMTKGLQSVKKELDQLEELFTSPGTEEDQKTETKDDLSNHRIFSYLESDADKQAVSNQVKEAIQKDMTYAEIDAFFTETLSAEVDEIVKDHPSLTKDYIRLCKKQ